MKLFISLVLLFLAVLDTQAQRECGTTIYTQEYFKPEIQKPVGSDEYNRDTVTNEIITIPVVVHLLYNTAEQNISDDQIRSQIEVLNRDFRRLNTDAANTPWLSGLLQPIQGSCFALHKLTRKDILQKVSYVSSQERIFFRVMMV